LPRKTDSTNPGDWADIAEADLALVRLAAANEVSFGPSRAKLAEALEKVLKAELIRLGWPLERTHDLQRLAKLLRERGSDLSDPAEPLVNALTEAYFSDRYPGFDLDDPNWPILRQQIEEVGMLLGKVKARVAQKS
jgi:HEPN domain-containing protein